MTSRIDWSLFTEEEKARVAKHPTQAEAQTTTPIYTLASDTDLAGQWTRIRVVCERCRAEGRGPALGTFQSRSRAEYRQRNHLKATGHAADLIPVRPGGAR